MKRILVVLALLTAACDDERKPLTIQQTSNPTYQVAYLFEQDGCRVYRFEDELRYRYFVTCAGSTSQQIQNGKTTRPDDIQTVVTP